MYYAIRDATGIDYCVTIADADYEPHYRKHASWWKRYMRNPSAETRAKYQANPKGLPCFPLRVVVED